MTPAERIYRRLLILLPHELRREAEPDLIEVFRDAHARVSGRGVLMRMRFWGRMAVDLAVTSIAERLSRIRSPTNQVLEHEPRSLPMALAHAVVHSVGDVRFAARQLARTPGWTLVAAGTLALGLGASVVAGVLMRDVVLAPLPIPHGDRLVRVLEISENGRRWWPSLPNARDWRDHGRMFDAVGIIGTPRIEPVLFGGTAARVTVAKAGRGVFEMLGVAPIAGRLFAVEENRAGGLPVAVVSERFWRGPMHERPLATAAVTIGSTSYSVVGVLPRELRILGEAGVWSEPADVWTPLEREIPLGRRTSHGEYHVVARLRDGVTLDRARTEMNDLARTLKAQHQEPTQADAVLLTPLHDVVVRSTREPVHLLLYAGLAVLLVSALNLASAILAQGLSRTRELLIRLALGATRWRLVLHLVMGAATLALPGTVLGLVLAAVGLQVIKSSAARSWPRLDEASLDPGAVVLAFAAASVVAILAGVVPALLLSRSAARDRLRTHGATEGAREPRVWKGFVAAQAAVTLVLLAGTGLLVRSFVEATRVDLGYEPERTLAIAVTLPTSLYAEPARRVAFYEAALERLRAIPGVEAAGITSVLPHETTAYTGGTSREGGPDRSVMAGYRLVDGGYFETLRIARVQGSETALGRGAALIDRTLHRFLWNGSTPGGERILNSFAYDALPVEGVVGTVREWYQGENTIGAIYADYRRHPERILSMHLVLRYGGDGATVATTAHRSIAALDPLVPLQVSSLAERVDEALQPQRLLVLLATGFGVTALLLAAAGVYAMMAFAARRQLREAAIRLALGARPATLQRRVLLQGLAPAALGTALGIGLTFPLADAIRAQLFQVAPTDPLAMGLAVSAVLISALGASAVPARRSARIDPAAVLRQE